MPTSISSVTNVTLPSHMAKLPPPGCALLKDIVYAHWVALDSNASTGGLRVCVFNGTAHVAIDALLQYHQFHAVKLGMASPIAKVFDRPSSICRYLVLLSSAMAASGVGGSLKLLEQMSPLHFNNPFASCAFLPPVLKLPG